MTQIAFNQITKYARHFFSGTLLSRISGMVRDVSMAAIFGDHPSVAAFMIAFRFSHFLRRILGEGTLQSIFIPHYEELRLQDEKRANAFFFRLNVLLITTLATIVLIVIGASSVKSFYTQSQSEVLVLFSWMFPSIIFICLYGLNISLLQCRNSFFSSSVAPCACNLIWICAIFIFAKRQVPEAMMGLALFTIIGFIVQWLITMPKTYKVLTSGMRNYEAPLFSIPHEIRTIGKATIFGLVGVTAVQINSFLDMLFAHLADVKGPIYLWYAIRLEQLPLALVGFACVYSIVPSLSRLIKSNSLDKAQDLLFFGYRRIFLLVIPCTFAIFALGTSSVNLLFGRGNFSEPAVMQTSWCLWAYGLSLLPATLTVYQSSLFYAYGDFKTPTIASLISVGANIALNSLFVFVFHWGAISIALSTSLSSCLNYWILKRTFSKKEFWARGCFNYSIIWKVAIVSCIALVSCFFLEKFLLKSFFSEMQTLSLPKSFTNQLLHFLSLSLFFIVVSLLSLLLMYKELFFELKTLLWPKEVKQEV